MYLYSSLLLLPLYILLGNSSPTNPLVLPGHTMFETTSSDIPFPSSNGTGFGMRPLNGFRSRPASIDFTLWDQDRTKYVIRVGSHNPDTGNGDPTRVTRGLQVIYDWLPSLTRPDGTYPSKIDHADSFDMMPFRKFNFRFTVNQFRFANTAAMARTPCFASTFVLPLFEKREHASFPAANPIIFSPELQLTPVRCMPNCLILRTCRKFGTWF